MSNRCEQDIRSLVENIVETEYEARGHRGTKTVIKVDFQKSILVNIHSEDPFLGVEFWNFLAKVKQKIANQVKGFGFTYKECKIFFDYCILEYEFKEE